MANVFISYSRKDKEAAHKLAEACENQELDVWIDWKGIEPTVDWWREVEKGIEEADNFLFLISPDSASSPVCKRELDHALRNGKRLIPVVARTTQSDTVASELRKLNWIYLREEDDFRTSFATLVTAIQTDYEWVQTHRRLQVKALEWEGGNHENSYLLRGKDLQDAEAQLALYSSKDPHPTDLQREYVLRSRQASDRQRRLVVSLSIGAAVVMALLAVFGFIQARLATERANIALARQLAAQGIIQAGTKPDLGMLLMQESMIRQAHLGLDETYETINSLFTTMLSGPRPLKYLRGHTKPVLKVAISPDSQWVASASADGTIRIWDIISGLTLYTLTGHAGSVNTISFKENNDLLLLASAGNDGTVRLWAWKDKSQPPQASILANLNVPVHAVTFSPTKMKLAIGGEDKIVRVYNLTTHQVEHSFTEHKGIIYGLAFSTDGAMLASTDSQNDLRLWDMTTGQPINDSHPVPYEYNQEIMHSIIFSPDNSSIATGYGYDAVQISPGGMVDKYLPKLVPHTSLIRDVAYSHDGTRFASASEDWRIGYCYNPDKNCESIIYLKAHEGPVNSLAFSSDNKWLVSGGEDGNVIVWNALFPYIARSLTAPSRANVQGLAFGPDNKTLVSSNWDWKIRLWNIENGSIIREFDPEQGILDIISVSPDGTKLAFSAAGPLRIWNMYDSGFRKLPPENGTSGVAFSPDGRWLATDNNDGPSRSICLWELSTGQSDCQPVPLSVLRVLRTGEGVFRIAFSPNGKWLAFSVGPIVTLWDLSDLTAQPFKIQILGSHRLHTEIWDLAFSPDGKWLASGGSDYKIRLWHVQNTQKSSPLIIPNSGRNARSIAFSPDGRILVSANENWTVSWWDINSRDLLAAPVQITPREREDSAAFSPDGKWLATGSFDGIINIWPGNIKEWKALACQVVSRNLTRAEYAQFINSDPKAYDNEYVTNPTCPKMPVESKGGQTAVP